MVVGLDRFRDRFKTHLHQYALIGGSACGLLVEQAGLSFRATREKDIVLLAEKLDAGFGRDFWGSSREERYSVAEIGEGVPARNRFVEPQAYGFPFMLEILSVRPGGWVRTSHPLKARAWLDMTERRAAGHRVQSKDITKHRRDVFHLYQIVDPEPPGGVPDLIQADMRRFITKTSGSPVEMKSLAITRSS